MNYEYGYMKKAHLETLLWAFMRYADGETIQKVFKNYKFMWGLIQQFMKKMIDTWGVVTGQTVKNRGVVNIKVPSVDT